VYECVHVCMCVCACVYVCVCSDILPVMDEYVTIMYRSQWESIEVSAVDKNHILYYKSCEKSVSVLQVTQEFYITCRYCNSSAL